MYQGIEHFRAGRAVGVPFMQSIITGSMAFVVALSMARLTESEQPGTAGLLTGSLAAALCWIVLLRRWLSLAGFLLGYDGAGQDESEPEAEQYEYQSVRIELVQAEGRNIQFFDLPASQQQLARLADGLLHGASFSEASWTGAGALFSRSQFRTIRDEWLRRGWLTWLNPDARAQGVQLTPAGKAVARHLAAMAGNGHHSPALSERVQ